jgi:hypothetical protein
LTAAGSAAILPVGRPDCGIVRPRGVSAAMTGVSPIVPNTENDMEDRGIPRQIVNVTITLSSSRNLAGEIQIDLDTRLSDFMNRQDAFIVIRDRNGTLRIINKLHIVEIMEV